MRSPSPHSIRSSQLKNKITDTSLFAELVKDRHKREQELKKLENLLEKKSDNKQPNSIEEPLKPNVDQVDNLVNHHSTPVPMDIDDIPIPADNKSETTPVKLNEISLPTTSVESLVAVPPPPPPVQNMAKTSLPPIKMNNTFTMMKKADTKVIKPKGVTKLPMPPGINQTDLEAIESPPSRSPTPPPSTKPKTPPRKGIMNLPMPPGMLFLIIICFFLIIHFM